MSKGYNHQRVEAKIQQQWAKAKMSQVIKSTGLPKKYILDMFSYPSGEGLHLGHPISYTATDILSRYYRAKGCQVLHPVGWDAFGLPAENYAIKMGRSPQQTTKENIIRFTKQLKSFGFSYNWSREINTADPAYYKWTQWLFLKLYEQGLAYRAQTPVNWCPSCQTVLANEQVKEGKCERCSSIVEQKNLTQWFFKITQYAQELLNDLDKLKWPEPLKAAQRNWIGRSVGTEVDFSLASDLKTKITVFTTRLDTIFGATYMVLAPEHPLLDKIVTTDHQDEVKKYQQEVKLKSELQRQEDQTKTGVFTGAYAVNPATKEQIPIWIADYVLMNYGTGAVMAVPNHDFRDEEFALIHLDELSKQIQEGKVFRGVVVQEYDAFGTKFTLPPPPEGVLDSINVFDGRLKNSGKYNGLSSSEAREKIAADLGAKKVTRYRLRDWLVSRQRYWGAPIPIIHCPKCGVVPVSEDQLPVELPNDVDFRPTGESPLVRSKKFNQGVKCPKCKGEARRETDTLDTFVCSSWYFLRYADPHNTKEPFSEQAIRQWLPVDVYVGGSEHAVGHLLFSRFITKALADHPDVKLPIREPFTELHNQGLLLGANGEKMSKSRGNVINSDEVIKQFGADAVRMYLMFMGPFEDAKPWSTNGLVGIRRFLERVEVLFTALIKDKNRLQPITSTLIHSTIKKVTDDITNFNFNTAISTLMIFFNSKDWRPKLNSEGKLESVGADMAAAEKFLLILHPFAPHLAEYLWQKLGHKQSIQLEPWPEFDPALVLDEQVTIAVQVNGKTRGSFTAPRDSKDDYLKTKALELASVKRHLDGKNIAKSVVVPNKIVSLVTD